MKMAPVCRTASGTPERVSTNDQDLTAQKNALVALGVSLQMTFTDQGLTGTNRARPGLREALTACRAGDTLVVTKLDRLARSLRDAKDIVDDLTLREVKPSTGGAVHDPTDPVGRLLFAARQFIAQGAPGNGVCQAQGHVPPGGVIRRRTKHSGCSRRRSR